MLTCTKCPLHKTRHGIVKGRGVIPADFLFIGEAPGVSEDVLGQAFIGPAGKLLDEMILEAHFPSDAKIFFTNTILCRPCDSVSGPNREPTKEEVLACTENVRAIIKEANPECVILVGDFAKQYYGRMFPDSVKITHPSALLKAGGKRAPGYRGNILKLLHLNLLNNVQAPVEGFGA